MFCHLLHLCCFVVVSVCYAVLSRVSFNFLSSLVALCYQFSYLFCPVSFVLMFVTPRDILLGSIFDGISDFAVIRVTVFPELQALQVFIWNFAELNPVCLPVVPSPYSCMLRLHCSVSELDECWSLPTSSSTVYCVLFTMSADTMFRFGVLVVPVDRCYSVGVAASS